MDRNKKYLFLLIGLAIGFIASFFATQSINRSGAAQPAAGGTGAPMAGGTGAGGEQTMANVQQTLAAARANPNDATAQIEAARMYYQIGQLNESIEFLKRAHQVDPQNFGVTATIANLYFDQKNYDEAESWYRRALDSVPPGPDNAAQKSDIYVEIAACMLQRQPADPDKAVAELQRALAIDGRNGHALGHLIEAHALKKNVAGAEEAFARLKEAEPNSPRLSLYQGMVADLKAGRPVTIPKE